MSDEVFFNIVYYSILFSVLLVGIISAIVAKSQIKLNFSEDKLRLMQKEFKKRMMIFFTMTLLFLTTIIPLYIFSPEYILLIQFIILFFSIVFFIGFIGYSLNYILIRKKLRCEESLELRRLSLESFGADEPEYHI